MLLPHLPHSIAWDSAPSPAPQQPGGLLPCQPDMGVIAETPPCPTRAWRGELRHSSFAGRKGRGAVSCSLPPPSPSASGVLLWAASPSGGKTEEAGRGRSFPSGRAAFARDVALALGLAQRELCYTRNTTENFTHLHS